MPPTPRLVVRSDIPSLKSARRPGGRFSARKTCGLLRSVEPLLQAAPKATSAGRRTEGQEPLAGDRSAAARCSRVPRGRCPGLPAWLLTLPGHDGRVPRLRTQAARGLQRRQPPFPRCPSVLSLIMCTAQAKARGQQMLQTSEQHVGAPSSETCRRCPRRSRASGLLLVRGAGRTMCVVIVCTMDCCSMRRYIS